MITTMHVHKEYLLLKIILKYCLKRVRLSELWDQFKQMETTKAVMMLGIECFATYLSIYQM